VEEMGEREVRLKEAEEEMDRREQELNALEETLRGKTMRNGLLMKS
jgi:hypothetical protein